MNWILGNISDVICGGLSGKRWKRKKGRKERERVSESGQERAVTTRTSEGRLLTPGRVDTDKLEHQKVTNTRSC